MNKHKSTLHSPKLTPGEGENFTGHGALPLAAASSCDAIVASYDFQPPASWYCHVNFDDPAEAPGVFQNVIFDATVDESCKNCSNFVLLFVGSKRTSAPCADAKILAASPSTLGAECATYAASSCSSSAAYASGSKT